MQSTISAFAPAPVVVQPARPPPIVAIAKNAGASAGLDAGVGDVAEREKDRAASAERDRARARDRQLKHALGLLLKHRGGPGFGHGRLQGAELELMEVALRRAALLLREESVGALQCRGATL